mmetsp:Transcript_46758/g.138139  ORF Transcript_46758/g.138139 Transcript_46758/m.138139 type:complete len:260 (-) Transcript_46758:16-795(-)
MVQHLAPFQMEGAFGAPPSGRKKEDWSPINRMLSNKKGPRKNSLPPALPATPPQAPQMKSTATQCVTWAVLQAEAAAPERSRANALEAEVRRLKAQLREREEGAEGVQARALEEAELRRQALERELAAARQAASDAAAAREQQRQSLEEERSRFEEERQLFDEERLRWQAERGEHLAAEGRWQEERGSLQAEAAQLPKLRGDLEQSRGDLDKLRLAFKELQGELKGLGEERDHLLHRLETEQAEMMARVEKLEAKRSGR